MSDDTTDLENALDDILLATESLLRSESFENHLHTCPTSTLFWRATIQELLGLGLSGQRPDAEKWRDHSAVVKETLDRITINQRDGINTWAEKLKIKPHLLVAQFFTANKERANAMISAENKQEWELAMKAMLTINRLNFNGEQGDNLSPHNIGNFVVQLFNKSKSPCRIFKLSLNEDGNTDACVIESGFLSRLIEMGLPDKIRQFAELSDSVASDQKFDELVKREYWHDPFFSKALESLNTYLNSYAKTYGVNNVVDENQKKVILLNNTTFSLIGLGDESISLPLVHYCFPAWHMDTSYLYLVVNKTLSKSSERIFHKFSERFLGLLWACDSYRKLEEDRMEILRHSRKAERAAVLARNFSHVTGSHVISNPKFRRALIDDGRSKYQKSLLQAHSCFSELRKDPSNLKVSPQKQYTQTIRAIGDELDKLKSGGDWLLNTTRFHEYLQGRFDFIARAIDDTRDPLEPVFFVADLIDTFLAQAPYLDTFVADLGIFLPGINIEVRLPDECSGLVAFETKWEEVEGEWGYKWEWKEIKGEWESERERKATGSKGTPQIEKHDQLVGVSGGMVSAHAFYSLLENVIRNSAKYGHLKNHVMTSGEGYRLTLELKDDSDRWTVRLWDNFSGAKVHDSESWKTFETLAKDIGEKINRDFVRDDGRPEREGLGLLEMQASVSSLFAKNTGSGEREVKKNLRLEEVKATPSTHNFLTFCFNLGKPCLLGIIRDVGPAERQQGTLIRTFKDLDELISEAPGTHIALLQGSAKAEVRKKWIEQIGSKHQQLPYRLLVVCADDNDHTTWQNEWSKAEKNHARRLLAVVDAQLAARLFARANQSDLSEEQGTVQECYRLWLKVWKGSPQVRPTEGSNPEGGWHLWIGLDRPLQQLKEIWEAPLNGFDDPLIQIAVRSSEKGAGAEGELITSKNHFANKWSGSGDGNYWKAEISRRFCQKQALVFDNHGKCFPYEIGEITGLESGPRFYQKLTGTLTPQLFRLLTHPPTSSFAFSFFILGLVEACLSQVMMVDERVAADLLFSGGQGDRLDPDEFKRTLCEHQKAGVFPVFKFGAKGDESGKYYSRRHQAALEELWKNTPSAALDREGVRFATTSDETSELKVLVQSAEQGLQLYEISKETGCSYQNTDQKCDLRCDALVIHEGALDLLRDGKGKAWESKFLKYLYSVSPAIFRTSGRGRQTRQFEPSTPFVEFSEVSSAVLTARNKFLLVRCLLATSGTEAVG